MITFFALLGCLIPSAIAFNAIGTDNHPMIVPKPPTAIVLQEDPTLKKKGINLPGYNHEEQKR